MTGQFFSCSLSLRERAWVRDRPHELTRPVRDRLPVRQGRVLSLRPPSPRPSPGGRGSRSSAVLLLLLAAAAPPGASSCTGCHMPGAGIGVLQGRDAADTTAQMEAFRSGARPATLMNRIVRGFTPDEVRALSAWFATP